MTSQVEGSRQLRADARDNRAKILAAARDVFIELGPGAPLEEISRRAGTGIATLYRRFPDRRSLMSAVVLDALQRASDLAQQAADEEPDSFAALVRYMHGALELRVAAVIAALLPEIPFDDPELARARSLGARRLQALVDAAHRAGRLAAQVTSGDIGMLVVRLSRPMPGIDRALNDALAHRHLDLLIHGLSAGRSTPTGPALTLEDLDRMRAAGPRSDSAGER